MATRQAITHLASTSDEGLLRFRLQMAEQARRLGERLKELREAHDWKQKDVVTAMEQAGDLALNTNQLSRYENGGAYPGEVRLQRFAEIFDVDISELLATPSKKADAPDLLDQLSEKTADATAPAILAALSELGDQVAALRAELLAELGVVRKVQEDQLGQQAPAGRRRAAKQN